MVFQVRHYEPAKWVTTEQKSYIMEVAMATAFGRLFKYITGSNEAGVCVWMCVCVRSPILISAYPIQVLS